jgi:oxygen-independent coproporphyrinogen-3 oxidase
VSVYALTVEAGTPWETLVRRGKRRLPDPDHQADLLLAAEAALTAAGLEHYEVASYAGRHAPATTSATGPGATTSASGPRRTRRVRRDGSLPPRQPARPSPLARGPSAPASSSSWTRIAAAAEGLWTGLRHLPGLDLAAFLRRFPAVDAGWIAARTRRQRDRGNLELGADVLRVAPGRWLWHDAIAADLLAYRPKSHAPRRL